MALQSLMSAFEVALRNRIHVSLSRQASEATGTTVDSFPWYDDQVCTHKLEGETYAKVERILCDAAGIRLPRQPPPERVIAKLSFGVWPNILDQQLGTQAIEARTFREVFSFHPKQKNHWKYGPNRKDAVDVVKMVRAWRNRIAHCKPIWYEGWYRSSATQHWTEVLDRVKSNRAGVLDVLGWICPDTLEVYSRSFGGRLFEDLTTEHAVMAHMQMPLSPGIGPTFAMADAEVLKAYKART